MRTIRTKIATHALLSFDARGVPLQIGLADAPFQGASRSGAKRATNESSLPKHEQQSRWIIDRSSAKAQEKRKRPAKQTAFFLIRSSQTGMTTKWVDEQVRLSHTLLKQ